MSFSLSAALLHTSRRASRLVPCLGAGCHLLLDKVRQIVARSRLKLKEVTSIQIETQLRSSKAQEERISGSIRL